MQKPINMGPEAATIMLQSIAAKHPFKQVFGVFGTPIPQEVMPQGISCRSTIWPVYESVMLLRLVKDAACQIKSCHLQRLVLIELHGDQHLDLRKDRITHEPKAILVSKAVED